MGCIQSDPKNAYEEDVKPISSCSQPAQKSVIPAVNALERVEIIGKGNFAVVALVSETDTRKQYALKIMSKHQIVESKQVEHVFTMRSLCERKDTKHPFILQHLAAVQTDKSIRVVMERCTSCYHTLRQFGRFEEPMTRYYIAQAVCALGHLHNSRIIHRNLKPETYLLDDTCNGKLGGFSICKSLEKNYRTWTLVGTPEYLAPETLLNKGHNFQVDWWAVGVLTYEFFVGEGPFVREDTMTMYKDIAKGKVNFPAHVSADARSFFKALCKPDVATRLGSEGDADEIAQHKFFRDLSWQKLLQGGVPEFCEALKPDNVVKPGSEFEKVDDTFFEDYKDPLDEFETWGPTFEAHLCGDANANTTSPNSLGLRSDSDFFGTDSEGLSPPQPEDNSIQSKLRQLSSTIVVTKTSVPHSDWPSENARQQSNH